MGSEEKDFEAAVEAYTHKLGPLTREDLAEALNVLLLFMQAKGLRVNFALVVASREGLATIGNLSPELQWAAYNMLAEKIERGAHDGTLPFEKLGKPDATH